MSERFPIRNDRHIIDEQGQSLLRSKLPEDWLINFTNSREYGVDFEVEIPFQGEMRANIFKGQLKSHSEVSINSDSTISQYIKYSSWNYWQRNPTPFFLFVADISNENVYWLNVKTLEIEYRERQEGITIRIPVRNEISSTESLNDLISDIIIELERDEEELIQSIRLPQFFNDIDKTYNIAEETLRICLEFAKKLFILYSIRNRIIYLFENEKGLKRFFLFLRSNYSRFALDLIHNLIERYNDSLKYLFQLSYILDRFYEYDFALMCLSKAREFANETENYIGQIKSEMRISFIKYHRNENHSEIINFFSKYKIKDIKSSLSEIECCSLLNFLGKIMMSKNRKNSKFLLENALKIVNKIRNDSLYEISLIKSAIYNHLSEVYQYMADFDKAKIMLYKALLINLRNSQYDYAVRKYNKLSELYYFIKKYKKGISYAKKGLKVVEKIFYSDIRLIISLKFSLFINLIEIESDKNKIEEIFEDILEKIENHYHIDYTRQYFTVLESFFFKMDNLSLGIELINKKIKFFSDLGESELINRYINYLKLLIFTFSFNQGSLSYEELINPLDNINFKRGFENDIPLQMMYQFFERHLNRNLMRIKDHEAFAENLIFDYEPFYFHDINRNLRNYLES